MAREVVLGNVMVDCDDEKKLQKFYGELLGWEMCELFERPAVRSSSGMVFLFIEEDDYIRPVWPEETGKQQKQMHFDFQVDSVVEMVKKAELLGAAKSKAQFGGKDFVTMLDPSGHLFCLCQIRMLTTERLVLRPWSDADAKSLFEYASDPDIGPIAGWPPHKNVEESLNVIRNVFIGAECYAICEKGNDKAIGAVELKLKGHTDVTERDDECELGYWLGKPFWGRGYMPEAVTKLIQHGFEDLGMTTIWCGYYDGNNKSERVQEKVGFTHHHTCDEVSVPLMRETRIGHTNYMTKEQWLRK